jgi:hypothetical protein
MFKIIDRFMKVGNKSNSNSSNNEEGSWRREMFSKLKTSV